jgi:dipeptidyl aminopeptidase/acylaminoacyl peptidase
MLPLIAALAVALVPVMALAQPPRNGTDPAGALAYDLAFDRFEFPWSTALAVSRDDQRIAYAVRQRPRDANTSSRYMPNGTPSSVVGSRVFLTDRTSGTTVDVCPGGNCWQPAWAPDGRTLAFYSDRDGPPQLWVHDLTSGRSRRVSPARVKAKLWVGDEAQWAPDNRTVFVPLAPDTGAGAWLPVAAAKTPAPVAADSPSVWVLKAGSEAKAEASAAAPSPRSLFYNRENNAAVAAIDTRSGAVRIVAAAEADPRPSVMRLSPSGRWVSYLSVFREHGITSQNSTMDLAVVPAAGGATRVVARDLPLLRDYHRMNYAWHPSEDKLVYLADTALFIVDLSGDAPAAPRRLGASLGALAPTLNWFTRDGRAVVVGTNPVDEKSYADVLARGLAVVPLDGSAPVRVAIDARYTLDDVLRGDARTVWQPQPGTLTATLTENATGLRVVGRFDVGGGAMRTLWSGRARVGSLTGGGSHDALFGFYEDVATPPDVYRFGADFAPRDRVSHVDPRLDRVAVGTAEVFETAVPGYNGALGTVRTAVLLPPGAKRGDRLPAVVLMYPGGDRSREAELFGGGGGLTIPNLLFTSRGYAVILPHLRLGPNREAGNPLKEMVDELLPQVYRAAELGYIDVTRLAIGGQSFGGYGTGSIISATNLFRAAVAVSGIYDLAGTYGYLDDNGGSFWVGWSEGGQARMGTHPWASMMRYLENSPYYRADKIVTPLLLVHGDEDMAYHDAQKLFSALRRLDRPVQLATYRGMGHVIYEWTRPNAVDAARRIVDFVRQHLGPARAPTVGMGESR